MYGQYSQKYSEKWGSNFPRCFRGEGYSQHKGELLEDIRRLERLIESLEEKLTEEKNINSNLQRKISDSEIKLAKIREELAENKLLKQLNSHLRERIEENKFLFKMLSKNLENKFLSKIDDHKYLVYLENVLEAQEEIIKNGSNSFAQKQLDKSLGKLSSKEWKDEVISLLEKQKKIIELENELKEMNKQETFILEKHLENLQNEQVAQVQQTNLPPRNN